MVELGRDEIFEREARDWVEHPMEHDLHDAGHLTRFDAVFEMLENEGKDVLDLHVDHVFGYRSSRVQDALVDQAVHVLCDLVDELRVAEELELVGVEHKVIEHQKVLAAKVTAIDGDRAGHRHECHDESAHVQDQVLTVTLDQVRDVGHELHDVGKEVHKLRRGLRGADRLAELLE